MLALRKEHLVWTISVELRYPELYSNNYPHHCRQVSYQAERDALQTIKEKKDEDVEFVTLQVLPHLPPTSTADHDGDRRPSSGTDSNQLRGTTWVGRYSGFTRRGCIWQSLSDHHTSRHAKFI